MKLQIVDHATDLLVEAGLAEWTLDRVAARTRCAKGLLIYHHRTRVALLGQVAARLRHHRVERRVKALERSGSDAIDALWRVIESEVASGEAAAWFSLVALRDPEVAEATRHSVAEDVTLAVPLARALSLDREAEALGAVSLAALDGFALALLQHAPATQVRDAYHRFWLGLLG
jgi:AcrR family transcriptional regulator